MCIELRSEAINLLSIETGGAPGPEEDFEQRCVVRNRVLPDRSAETAGCKSLCDRTIGGDDQLLLFAQSSITKLKQGCLHILAARIEMAARSRIMYQIDVIHE